MLQIVKQTWDERYDMYMRLPKEKLAEMLAECAKYVYPQGCAELDTDKQLDASTVESASIIYAHPENQNNTKLI